MSEFSGDVQHFLLDRQFKIDPITGEQEEIRRAILRKPDETEPIDDLNLSLTVYKYIYDNPFDAPPIPGDDVYVLAWGGESPTPRGALIGEEESATAIDRLFLNQDEGIVVSSSDLIIGAARRYFPDKDEAHDHNLLVFPPNSGSEAILPSSFVVKAVRTTEEDADTAQEAAEEVNANSGETEGMLIQVKEVDAVRERFAGNGNTPSGHEDDRLSVVTNRLLKVIYSSSGIRSQFIHAQSKLRKQHSNSS